MTRLEDHTERARADARLIEACRGVAQLRDPDSLGWVVAPEMSLKLVEGVAAGGATLARHLPRSLASSIVGGTGPILTTVGPVMLASTSIQHDRVFAPIIHRLERHWGSAHVGRLPRLSGGQFPRAGRATAALLDRLRRSAREIPTPEGFGAMVLQSSTLLARARRLFAGPACPKVLLVGTQHGAAIRALIRAAIDDGSVRVVYMPHAPLADNPWYHDLPAHWALLRGTAEFDVYRSLGVDEQRLHVVGDPSVPDVQGRVESVGSRILYAVSTDSARSVRGDIDVIGSAGCEEVEVAMHPRLRERADLHELFPSAWALNPLPSTFARMQSAPPAVVVQHGSGVGLEALSLGLAVVDLCNPGRRPNYHYLAPPVVPVVADSDRLRSAIDAVGDDLESVELRRATARRWMVTAGEDAADAACDQLVCIAESPLHPTMLLDGWAAR